SFENGAGDNIMATITTLDGKSQPASVARYNTHAYTLDVSGLKPGFYIIDVTNGDQAYRRKLLVE
ncbi:MAG TPA: T9SS type A sorting domain-containing protein, partial [Bacteroidia bacterium]|nr:T9SS type A sorting domain-containing protein [Bacteroidia bacterium]